MNLIKQVLENTTTGSKIAPQKILERYCCMGCRKEVWVKEFTITIGPLKGQTDIAKIGCDCELIAKVKQEQRVAKKERTRFIFEENSLINQSLRDATFENFERGEFGKAYQKAWKYVENFDRKNPRNLFFQGSFGTGKSHLSVSIAKELTKKGYTTIFISTPKLLTKIRGTYNKSSEFGEEQIIQTLTNADLVVFDDIGAEGDISGWGMQKIFEVIDQRAGKSSVFKKTLSSSDFESTRDLNRIFSRMMMNSEPVIMNGTDYRRRQFMKGSRGYA
ncbi:ATP-binding protein [Siminovitchia terrae]|uniref:ATP-binding protein n=1 Tax=Siminovitchia terrae TaxID=1914933 RepID=UPI0028A7CE1E|nr:ATP-binding protein [Siminovitchia terrae]